MTPSSRLFTLVSAAALLLLTAQSAVTRGQTQGRAPVLLQITDADSAAQAIGAPLSIHPPTTSPVAATASANQTQSPIRNTGTQPTRPAWRLGTHADAQPSSTARYSMPTPTSS
jgi:hypothetical protein